MAVGDSPTSDAQAPGEDAGDYCRALEAYLCRKNDGHLIRIVGPSFEMVCGWASRGVPIAIAERGIDRCFERYYAKGARRRPVRIEFCEADVLDVFDEWKRAVGIPAHITDGGDADRAARETLPAHLERVVARLTAVRAGRDRSLDDVIDGIVRELDAARLEARALRGRARADFLARLERLDSDLMAAACARLSDAERDSLRRDAEAELAPFRSRMAPEAFERSIAACIDRLVRDRNRLPRLTLE